MWFFSTSCRIVVPVSAVCPLCSVPLLMTDLQETIWGEFMILKKKNEGKCQKEQVKTFLRCLKTNKTFLYIRKLDSCYSVILKIFTIKSSRLLFPLRHFVFLVKVTSTQQQILLLMWLKCWWVKI